MEKKSWMLKLQDKWELDSLFQVVIVLIVFGLTGTTIAMTKIFFMSIFGMEDASIWVKILFGIIAYQILILIFGTLFGQFKFFWKKEKKLVKGIGKLFKWIFTLPVRALRTINQNN